MESQTMTQKATKIDRSLLGDKDMAERYICIMQWDRDPDTALITHCGFCGMPRKQECTPDCLGRQWEEQSEMVTEPNACPVCGEREMDELVWADCDTVHCYTCGADFDPMANAS